METQLQELKLELALFCIVLLWVLQRYYILNRPLKFMEKCMTFIVGVSAGTGMARLLRFQTLSEALAALQVTAEIFAVAVVIFAIVVAAYKVTMSLVALRKT